MFFSLFFVLILIFSISSIQASDVNITDSSTLSSNDDISLQIEDETDFSNSQSDDSNNLSLIIEDVSVEEDDKNQTELSTPTTSIYYSGYYNVTLTDSNASATLANKTLNFIINDVNYTATTDDYGVAHLNLNLEPGTYTAIVNFVGDEAYEGSNLISTLEILPTISSSDLNKVEGDSRKFTANFYDCYGNVLANTYVKIKVNGKTYSVKTDSKGKATLSLDKLKAGTYEVICYNIDGLTQTNKIKVYKKKASTQLTTQFYTFFPDDKKQIKVQLMTQLNDDSNVGKTIKIKINGKTYSKKTDSEGAAYFSVASLKKGLYVVEYEYAGDDYFKSSKTINYVTILNNAKTSFKVISTKSFGYGAGTQLKVSFTADGVPLAKRIITFTINGKTYTKYTDSNGIASMTINFNIGSYKVYYKTYDQYKINETSGSFDINVFKRPVPKLIWKSPKSFKDRSQKFKILCADSKGHVYSGVIVKLTIDSETFTAKTSSKGYVTFKTYVPIGKYKVSLKSKSNNELLDGSASKSVKVKLSKFRGGINEKNHIPYLKKYLKSSSHCKVGSKKIKKLVKKLTKGLTRKTDKAKAIFNYVRDTLSYSYYYDTKYGAVGTLKAKKGNCVDHSHLLVSMYRTAGLKARYVHGVCHFSDGTYGHVWTQVLIGKNWVCGDAISYSNSLGKIKNWNTKTCKIRGKYASLPF